MKKVILIIVIAIVVLAIFYFWPKDNNYNINQEVGNVNNLANMTPEEMLATMTLEDKVGQMFMVGFWGTEPDYYISKMINQRNIGGVILMKYNIDNAEQTEELINKIQEMSLETNPGIPLFISVDQEGGIVSRVKVDGVEEFSAQPDITSVDQAYLVAEKRAKELLALGININLSPVVDYSDTPESFLYGRTFRGNVGELGSAMVNGYQQNGLISTVKHFLGHPDTGIDPHQSVLKSDFSNNEIMDRIKTYRGIIADSSPDMIMTSHVIYKNIDPDTPCSLSRVCIQDWLRGEARFGDGIVITDDMEMAAIADQYSNAEAVTAAVLAGNDILLYTSEPEDQAEAYNTIVQAVKDGKINEEQIDSSVLKILRLKKAF